MLNYQAAKKNWEAGRKWCRPHGENVSTWHRSIILGLSNTKLGHFRKYRDSRKALTFEKINTTIELRHIKAFTIRQRSMNFKNMSNQEPEHQTYTKQKQKQGGEQDNMTWGSTVQNSLGPRWGFAASRPFAVVFFNAWCTTEAQSISVKQLPRRPEFPYEYHLLCHHVLFVKKNPCDFSTSTSGRLPVPCKKAMLQPRFGLASRRCQRSEKIISDSEWYSLGIQYRLFPSTTDHILHSLHTRMYVYNCIYIYIYYSSIYIYIYIYILYQFIILLLCIPLYT